jgi:hypothetical protein
MPTTAVIGLILPDGKIKATFCGYDGYLHGPCGVGSALYYHYRNLEKIEALVQLGPIKSLGAIPEFPPRDSDLVLTRSFCTVALWALAARNAFTMNEFDFWISGIPSDFIYLHNGDKWWYRKKWDIDFNELTLASLARPQRA